MMATIASARASPDVPSIAEKKVSASDTRVQAVIGSPSRQWIADRRVVLSATWKREPILRNTSRFWYSRSAAAW